MSYPVSSTPTIYVDHDALRHLLERCAEPNTKAILVGFGEYAKHLINLCPASIVAVYDPDPILKGIKFRDKPVVDIPDIFDANLIVGCEYRHLYGYLGRVIRHFSCIPHYYPPQLHYKSTAQINVFEQEEIYHDVFKNEQDAPISMMGPEKLRLLVELLRTGLSLSPEANVLEMGSWQGGSSWFIAKTLRYLKQRRIFYMLDLFETHMINPTATMCTSEISARMRSVYDSVELIVGLVDDPMSLAKVQGPLCFSHIDLGWQEQGLSFVWGNLVPGAPLLLDNYGHLAAPPWWFDDFFKSKGTRVTRLPWSEQGLVFKV